MRASAQSVPDQTILHYLGEQIKVILDQHVSSVSFAAIVTKQVVIATPEVYQQRLRILELPVAFAKRLRINALPANVELRLRVMNIVFRARFRKDVAIETKFTQPSIEQISDHSWLTSKQTMSERELTEPDNVSDHRAGTIDLQAEKNTRKSGFACIACIALLCVDLPND